MASDIAKRTNHFTELSPSIGLSRWIGHAAAAMARAAWQIVVAVKHRRELSRLADRDDRMLADIGLTRSDLHAARSEPLWRDPTNVLQRSVSRKRAAFELSAPTSAKGVRQPSADRPARYLT
jgi:uncharacterized protein YjiS (DUF1127 family)